MNQSFGVKYTHASGKVVVLPLVHITTMHFTFAYNPSMKEMNPVAAKFTEEWNKVHPDKAPNIRDGFVKNNFQK